MTILGCSFAYKVGARLILVTAAHVASRLAALDVVVPLRPGGGGTRSLGLTRVTPSDELADVALVELLDSDVESAIRRGWLIATVHEILRDVSSTALFTVGGFPSAVEIPVSDGVKSMYHSFLVARTTEAVESGFDPDRQLAMTHKKSMTTIIGKGATPPRLNGISGSPIWALTTRRPSELLDARVQVKICGVEVAVKHDSYILGTRWSEVERLLANIAHEKK
jgi:hypothetical protein